MPPVRHDIYHVQFLFTAAGRSDVICYNWPVIPFFPFQHHTGLGELLCCFTFTPDH